MSGEATASWVILTRGDRPELLGAAVESVARQRGVVAEVLIVGNGAAVQGVDDSVGRLVLPENVGIPAGRNQGVRHTTGDVIFFLDDDARYGSPQVASEVIRMFDDDPALGIVSLRLRDPVTGITERRHVPRLGRTDPARSGEVTTFLGGASAIRRDVFAAIGGFPDDFFYAHEETDLAWRAIDAGYRIVYRGDLTVLHPATAPSRHPEYHFRSARNRVWLARRRLPGLLVPFYVTIWAVASLVRARSRANRREVLRGLRAGRRQPAGARIPIRWSTVWRLTRLGRPPVV